MLLYHYIKQKEPNQRVFWLDSWPESTIGSRGATYLRDMLSINANDGSVIILDEAQLSYWDKSLWATFFKPICDGQWQNRVAIFTSYGSATSSSHEKRENDVVPTPMVIPLVKKITLRPVEHLDGIPPVGLFLTYSEFQTYIAVRHPFDEAKLNATTRELVYSLTAGHVGAIHDLLGFITAQDVRLITS